MTRSGSLSIVAVAILAEGVLYGLFVLWAYWRGVPLVPQYSSGAILAGLIATIPLCLINGLLLYAVRARPARFSQTREFVDRIVKPLADELGIATALVVSLAAGFCEELFFRGALMSEFGLIASSVFFSLMHFGPAARTYKFLVILYAVLGGYLGFVVILFGSIWPAIIAHVLYDFIALVYMRWYYKPIGD